MELISAPAALQDRAPVEDRVDFDEVIHIPAVDVDGGISGGPPSSAGQKASFALTDVHPEPAVTAEVVSNRRKPLTRHGR